ncbi:MAG: DNA polymerase III subunit delta [Flavobacteriaceae bacterium]|nr:MAG: DNA polymerase III subunit delta [Flavobacteriaceae bacterium]
MNDLNQIIGDIKKGDIKPVYLISGDEPYFIDEISDYIEKNILSEDEKGFNQMVMYGGDAEVMDIVSNAKRFPMMAERQVIIVKEAQELARSIESLASYVENPQTTTMLVLCYKYKKLDKRKKLYKVIKKNGVIFEGKKMYDNQIGDWIRKVLSDHDYGIENKAVQMLVEFLGTDLSRIFNELEKLMVILPVKTTISDQIIEDNIGISKDFNNFELRKAIGNKNVLLANQIINYFSQNPKNNPLVMTISLLNSFFTQLFMYHALKDKSRPNVAVKLKISPYFVADYSDAARNYPMRKVSQVISVLREADLKSKGVGANALPQSDLLKELLFKIMH